MLDLRDPKIKLFGKTIPVVGEGDESNDSSNSDHETEKETLAEESMEIDQAPSKAVSTNQPSDHEKDSDSPNEKESIDVKNSEQKPLKKPDKILPCPRCNSMDTKFCYYNNYNINQPRHFCKSCQRYWTAGGTMRNVPVGAGRRKSKSSSLKYCHVTVSDALQAAARIDVPNGMKTNGTFLTFGSESPLCESMASVLNISDRKILNGDDDDLSTVTTNGSMIKTGPQEPNKQNPNGFTNKMPCFQWPYMWNPTVSVPAFCPMSFYPSPYWNNNAIPWNINMPWVSNPSSPTLGKHSREGEMIQPSNKDKCSSRTTTTTTVLVPKTLRIDDPDEAAKSSIWTTLGIKKEKGGDFITKGGFFNSFQSKAQKMDQEIEVSPALKANPAALCRSTSFQESA